MWDLLPVALLLMFVAYRIWRAISSGEFGELTEFGKMLKELNEDIFGGETRNFVLKTEAGERTVGVKTYRDVDFWADDHAGTIWWEQEGPGGRHFTFQITLGADDIMTLVEMDGEEEVRKAEFNLDKSEGLSMMNTVTSYLHRISGPADNEQGDNREEEMSTDKPNFWEGVKEK